MSTPSPVAGPSSSPTRPCFRWKLNGSCHLEDKCPYSHEDPHAADLRNDSDTLMWTEGPQNTQSEGQGLSSGSSRAIITRARHASEDLSGIRKKAEKKGAAVHRRPVMRQGRMSWQDQKRLEVNAPLFGGKEARSPVAVNDGAMFVEKHILFDSNLVSFSAGLDVQHVVTGFQLSHITVNNLPSDATKAELERLFYDHGIPKAEFLVLRLGGMGEMLEATVLMNADYIRDLAGQPEMYTLRGEQLTFKVSNNTKWNSIETAVDNTPFITLKWGIPTNPLMAYYSSAEEAERRAQELDGQIWNGYLLAASLYRFPRGSQRNTSGPSGSPLVYILNCPPNAQYDNDFREFAGARSFRGQGSFPYNHDRALQIVREHLASFDGIQVTSLKDFEPGGQVEFASWLDAGRAAKALDGHHLSLGPSHNFLILEASYPNPYIFEVRFSHRQYIAQKRQWDDMVARDGDVHVKVVLEEKEGVSICVEGYDKKAIGLIKVQVDGLMAGETLGPTYWHPSFVSLRDTQELLDSIHACTKGFARCDFRTRTLRAFGEPTMIQEAKVLIKSEVERREKLEMTKFIDQESIAFFVREGLARLQDLLGPENVRLSLIRPYRITIKGGEDARHHLQRIVDKARSSSSTVQSHSNQNSGKTCPICYDVAENPEHLACGHSYCTGCLKHFLESAADVDFKKFPLACMATGETDDSTCNTPIPLPFLHQFLSDQAFKRLSEVAFNHYVDTHPQEIHYCKTPDCRQMYRRSNAEDGLLLQCPSCHTTVCAVCDSEDHAGMSCKEMRQRFALQEQENMSAQLAQERGWQRCPRCQVFIEKMEGCNHVACKCGAHICWKCLKTFPSGRKVYQHLRQAHAGNIYDPPAYEPIPPGLEDGIVDGNALGGFGEDFLAAQLEELARLEMLHAQEQALLVIEHQAVEIEEARVGWERAHIQGMPARPQVGGARRDQCIIM